MDDKKAFGERVKELRKSLNLSQAKFAAPLKISQASISSIEDGGGTDIVNVKLISKVYNVTLDWLIEGKGQMHKMPEIKDFKMYGQSYDERVTRLQEQVDSLKASIYDIKEKIGLK